MAIGDVARLLRSEGFAGTPHESQYIGVQNGSHVCGIVGIRDEGTGSDAGVVHQDINVMP